ELDVVEVSLDFSFLRFVLDLDVVRKRDRGEDADDHDHDKQLDQGEALTAALGIQIHFLSSLEYGCACKCVRPRWTTALSAVCCHACNTGLAGSLKVARLL